MHSPLLVSFAFFALLGALGCSEDTSPKAPVSQDVGLSLDTASSELDSPPGYTAVVSASQSQNLSLRYEGVIQSLKVGVGDEVRPGTFLAVADSPEVAADLELAKSALATAESDLHQKNTQVRETERQVALAKSLYRQKVRSRESVRLAGFALSQARSEMKQAAAKTKGVAAQVSELEDRLEARTLRAKINGVVSSISVSEGQQVRAGQRLLQVVALGDALVRFAIAEDELSLIAKRDFVRFVLNDGQQGERAIELVVEELSPTIDPTLKLAFAVARPTQSGDLKSIPYGTVGRVRLGSATP